MNLNLLVLRTHQMEELKLFYSKLGANFEKEQHGNGPVHYAAKLDNGMVLEIYPAINDNKPDQFTRLGFSIQNLESTIQILGSSTKPKLTPWGFRAVLHDPDGRAVELLETRTTKNQEGQT